jgi:hypothetical protein
VSNKAKIWLSTTTGQAAARARHVAQTVVNLLENYRLIFRLTPTIAAVPVVMLPVGIITLVMGAGASRAFTLMPGGGMYGHLVGFLLAAGSILNLTGMLRSLHLVEAIGAGLVSAGAFLYAFGVVLGLGWNGIIAGGGFLAIAIGGAGRVAVLAHRANEVKRRREAAGQP